MEVRLPGSRQPLQEVLDAIRQKLPCEAMEVICLRYGRRYLQSDKDLLDALRRAQEANASLQLRVTIAEGREAAFKALIPSAPEVTVPVASMYDGELHQMLSFYKFDKLSEDRLQYLEAYFTDALCQAGALGTVYIAQEGLNAQLAVPCSQLALFRDALGRLPEMAGVALNEGKVRQHIMSWSMLQSRMHAGRQDAVVWDGGRMGRSWRRPIGIEFSRCPYKASLLPRLCLQRRGGALSRSSS